MDTGDTQDAGRLARSRAAVVVEVLPNSQFLVELEAEAQGAEAPAEAREITVHLAGAMRVAAVRLMAGDRVRVELSPFDPTRGRITGLGPRRRRGGGPRG